MHSQLNSNHLKLIAITAMTIDHIADLIYPAFPANPIAVILHIVGRLTAPIMWFFICEGFWNKLHSFFRWGIQSNKRYLVFVLVNYCIVDIKFR